MTEPGDNEIERVSAELLTRIIPCEWGRTLTAAVDTGLCDQRATVRIVLHDGPREFFVQVCDRHAEIVFAETNPHKGE